MKGLGALLDPLNLRLQTTARPRKYGVPITTAQKQPYRPDAPPGATPAIVSRVNAAQLRQEQALKVTSRVGNLRQQRANKLLAMQALPGGFRTALTKGPMDGPVSRPFVLPTGSQTVDLTAAGVVGSPTGLDPTTAQAYGLEASDTPAGQSPASAMVRAVGDYATRVSATTAASQAGPRVVNRADTVGKITFHTDAARQMYAERNESVKQILRKQNNPNRITALEMQNVKSMYQRSRVLGLEGNARAATMGRLTNLRSEQIARSQGMDDKLLASLEQAASVRVADPSAAKWPVSRLAEGAVGRMEVAANPMIGRQTDPVVEAVGQQGLDAGGVPRDLIKLAAQKAETQRRFSRRLAAKVHPAASNGASVDGQYQTIPDKELAIPSEGPLYMAGSESEGLAAKAKMNAVAIGLAAVGLAGAFLLIKG